MQLMTDLHVVISLKDGALVATPTGQKTEMLYAEKEDLLFLKTAGYTVRIYKK